MDPPILNSSRFESGKINIAATPNGVAIAVCCAVRDFWLATDGGDAAAADLHLLHAARLLVWRDRHGIAREMLEEVGVLAEVAATIPARVPRYQFWDAWEGIWISDVRLRNACWGANFVCRFGVWTLEDAFASTSSKIVSATIGFAFDKWIVRWEADKRAAAAVYRAVVAFRAAHGIKVPPRTSDSMHGMEHELHDLFRSIDTARLVRHVAVPVPCMPVYTPDYYILIDPSESGEGCLSRTTFVDTKRIAEIVNKRKKHTV